MTVGKISLSGKVTPVLIKGSVGPGMAWKVRNTLRLSYIWGVFTTLLAQVFSKVTGLPVFTSKLSAVLIKADGKRIDFGVVSRRVVTTAGVGYIVDAFQNTVELENMKYHGCGTGNTAEASGDTALVTECTTTLNPDSTRATGTTVEGASANIFKTVGTATFDGSAAVVEHGIFSQAATGGGVLLDRSVFTAINVASADSIQFTYELTLTAGS